MGLEVSCANIERIREESRARNARKPAGSHYKAKLRHKYGLELETVQMLLEHQDGRCAICRVHIDFGGTLHVDHCHTSGALRGLLCRQCNWGLGHFRDDVEILTNAIRYLNRAKE